MSPFLLIRFYGIGPRNDPLMVRSFKSSPTKPIDSVHTNQSTLCTLDPTPNICATNDRVVASSTRCPGFEFSQK